MIKNLHITTDSNFTIKPISAEETYAIRQPILRAGKPIDDCKFEGDTLESTFHLGLFFNDTLIGVASYMKNHHANFSEEYQYQLRGMAILKEHQKKGLGTLLIQAGKEELSNRKVDRLWFNARETAIQFYKNHGYIIEGESFNIEGVGIHFLMTNK